MLHAWDLLHSGFWKSNQPSGRQPAPAANRSQVVLQSRRKFGKCPRVWVFFRRGRVRSMEIRRALLMNIWPIVTLWPILIPYVQKIRDALMTNFMDSFKTICIHLSCDCAPMLRWSLNIDHCAHQFCVKLFWKVLVLHVAQGIQFVFFDACVDRSWLIHFQPCGVLIRSCCNGRSGSWTWPEMALSTSGAQNLGLRSPCEIDL